MNRSVRLWLLAFLCALVAACGGGGGDAGPVAGPGPGPGPNPNPAVAPSISSFTAGHVWIVPGSSTTLTPVFANGTGTIGGVGSVASGVPVTVSPTANTTYTLTVTGSSGASITSTVKVAVQIVLTMGTADLPRNTAIDVNAAGYFKVAGLTAGHRYGFNLTTPNSPSVKYFSDAYVTEIKCDPNIWQYCSIVAPGEAIWIRIGYGIFDSGLVTVDGKHVSAPQEFEGAWDAPKVLSQAGMPHVGKVDEHFSYYEVQGLSAGTKYTVWLQGMTGDARLSTIDPVSRAVVGGRCDPNRTWIDGFSSPESCTFAAADTKVLIGIDNSHAALHPNVAYLLRVQEAVASQGSAAAPVVLNYAAGRAQGPGRVAQAGQSFYRVSGLQAGANYLLTLHNVEREVAATDFDPVSFQLFGNDPAFTSVTSCTGLVEPMPAYAVQCAFTSAGSDLYFKVIGPLQFSGMSYDLVVTPVAVNEGGGQSANIALTPAILPFKGQVFDWFSNYTLTGLTPNTFYQVFLKDISAYAGFEAWDTASSVIVCGGAGQVEATCGLSSGPNGAINIRTRGFSDMSNRDAGVLYTIHVVPGPVLTTAYTHRGPPVAIQDPTASNLPVTPTEVAIAVNGSAVTSISDVTVEMHIAHGVTSQLTVELVAPDGTAVTLIAPGVLSGDGIVGLKLNDYASKQVSEADAPHFGTFRPHLPLHVLRGKNANGTWKLRIKDDQYANISTQTGVYRAWGISFQ
jgi:subtilisin-like proprotein convertase family protein